MFKGCHYTKEEMKEMQVRDNKLRKERSEKITNAFNAMLMQVVSLLVSMLLLITMIILGLSYKTPDEKQMVYYVGMGFFFFTFLTLYMGKVRANNQVEW